MGYYSVFTEAGWESEGGLMGCAVVGNDVHIW